MEGNVGKEELVRREREAILRLKARRLSHLESYVRKMAGLTLASRFRMEHLLFVGGYGVLFIATDTGLPAEPYVVVKFPFMDWSRPGRTTVRKMNKRRRSLAREAELLEQGEGRILPALVASFREPNPLIIEPVPRLVDGERFVAMELIAGNTPDVAARATAKELGRDSPGFGLWVSRTLRSIGNSLIQLEEQFPELLYMDIAARNFMLTNENTVRVVDAGALVPRGTPLSRVPYTPKYCTLTRAERREPADERVIVRRLAALGLDLLTDKVSLKRRPQVVLEDIRDDCLQNLKEILSQALAGSVRSLGDFVHSLETLEKP